MNKILVKICGITNAEDARWAANLGADFVGLNFCKESPRKVSLEKAKEITNSLPPFVKAVGVFVNPELSELKKLLASVKISVLQFHGNESAEFVHQIKSEFSVAVWKAVRVEDEESVTKISEFKDVADTILLDSFKNNQLGGTGESFDWKIALRAKEYGIPIFLAGGLSPENVSEAIKKVEPSGVDVASGVEKEGHPRKKDVEKMKLFIQRAKRQ